MRISLIAVGKLGRAPEATLALDYAQRAMAAGRSLGQTEAGTLARLVLNAAIQFTPLAALALVAHPAARFGHVRADLERAARALELGVFRAIPLGALDNLDQAFALARVAANDRHAHSAIRAIGVNERIAGERLARDIVSVLAPLRAIGPAAPLRDCLRAHRAAAASPSRHGMLTSELAPRDTGFAQPARRERLHPLIPDNLL